MILFIEDETHYVESFIDELRLHFNGRHEIVVVETVDDALSKLRELNDLGVKPALVIVDIMMPPGHSFGPEETNGGFRTGVALLERMRPMSVPTIVFTNVNDGTVTAALEAEGYTFIRKPDVLPHEFAERVEEALRSGSRPREQ